MSKKVIGILGGMGPLATADLFQKITLHTVAACDQAHPRVCIDSNTDIADRTAALLHGGEDPVPEMIKSAKRLESIGADFLIMPCNTAHNYYEQVCEAVTIPVLHMIALTRDALKERGVKCAGLLATDGTVQTGIYQRTFEQSGVELLTPDSAADQAAVMDVIYNGVKAGDLTHDVTAFRAACERLSRNGTRSVVLTGVMLRKGEIGACVFDRASGGTEFLFDTFIGKEFHGTGDVFASVLTGALVKGKTLHEAVRLAEAFVRECAIQTMPQNIPAREGVDFEPILWKLHEGL